MPTRWFLQLIALAITAPLSLAALLLFPLPGFRQALLRCKVVSLGTGIHLPELFRAHPDWVQAPAIEGEERMPAASESARSLGIC